MNADNNDEKPFDYIFFNDQIDIQSKFSATISGIWIYASSLIVWEIQHDEFITPDNSTKRKMKEINAEGIKDIVSFADFLTSQFSSTKVALRKTTSLLRTMMTCS
ncbi:hypothetical protein RIF29_15043 [Crotalaria pallida]|uniref:Uncharacterized protein n=1 Tax=Crotalaria pallida TaxID=3830 RepID=A0AAN9FCW0_CROPI